MNTNQFDIQGSECNIMTVRLHLYLIYDGEKNMVVKILYEEIRKNMIVKILVDHQCKLHHDYTVNTFSIKYIKKCVYFLVLTKRMSETRLN